MYMDAWVCMCVFKECADFRWYSANPEYVQISPMTSGHGSSHKHLEFSISRSKVSFMGSFLKSRSSYFFRHGDCAFRAHACVYIGVAVDVCADVCARLKEADFKRPSSLHHNFLKVRIQFITVRRKPGNKRLRGWADVAAAWARTFSKAPRTNLRLARYPDTTRYLTRT